MPPSFAQPNHNEAPGAALAQTSAPLLAVVIPSLLPTTSQGTWPGWEKVCEDRKEVLLVPSLQ